MLGREVAGERVLGLVEVVVGVEHGQIHVDAPLLTVTSTITPPRATPMLSSRRVSPSTIDARSRTDPASSSSGVIVGPSTTAKYWMAAAPSMVSVKTSSTAAVVVPASAASRRRTARGRARARRHVARP